MTKMKTALAIAGLNSSGAQNLGEFEEGGLKKDSVEIKN